MPLADLSVADLAVDPHQPDSVYAVTYGSGLLRSDDGGTRWTPLPGAPAINQLAFDPAAGDALLAATRDGAYRSADRGASWQRIGFARDDVEAVAADPVRPQILLAAVTTQALEGGIFRSRDDGRTWTAVSDVVGVSDLVPDLAHPGTFYATDNEEIYKSLDHGATWRVLPPPFFEPLTLAVSATGVLFAGTLIGGVLRSGDGGLTWTPDADASVFAPADSVYDLLASPTDPQAVLAGGARGVWRSADGGATWRPSPSGLLASAPTSVAVGADAAHSVFCLASQQLLRSRDHGERWQAPGSAFAELVATDPVRPDVLYLVDDMLKSSDGGRSYVGIAPVPGGVGFDAAAFAIDPHTPETLYVSGTSYIGAGRNQAPLTARSADGGATWTPIAADLDTFMVLAIAPSRPSTLYAAEYGRLLWVSTDSGDTWTPGGAVDDVLITALAVDPANRKVVYAGTSVHGVYRSLDGGAHFAPFNAGLPAVPVATLLADPSAPGTLYAAMPGRGVYRFHAADGTWRAIDDGLPVLDDTPRQGASVLALDAVTDVLYTEIGRAHV